MNSPTTKTGVTLRFLASLILTLTLIMSATLFGDNRVLAAEQAAPSLPGPTALAQALPVDPELHTGKLANGLTYYIRRNVKPKQHVELRLVIKVGSILEDVDQLGLAHFSEHLAFDGTRHFPSHTLTTTLESLGVKFGADLNAFTSYDDTIYILQLPLDKPDNLDTGLQILEDWAQGALMTDQSIAQERPVVLEEARMAKGAQDRMNKQLIPEVFNGSRYAERTPIGSESILMHFKPETIRRFYHDWYRPDLQAVIIVGDIDPDQVLAAVKQHFSGLTNPTDERVRDYPKIMPRDQSAGVVVTDPEAVVNTLTIRYPIQAALPEATLGDYRRILMRRLCLDMMNFRLTEQTQQSEPPFVGASYSMESTAVGMETLLATAVIGHDRIVPALSSLALVNRQLRTSGFTDAELDRAKKNMLHQFDVLYSERAGTHSATFVDIYRRNFLFQRSTIGVGDQYKLESALTSDINLQEVNQLLRELLPVDVARLVTLSAARDPNDHLPDGPGLLHMLVQAERDDAQKDQQRETGKTLATELMARPTQSATVIAKRNHQGLGLTEVTLSNGVKVLFKPTGLQKEQVLLSAVRFGGQSMFSTEDKFNAQYATQLQAAMGVGNYSPIDMANILSGKSVRLQTELGMYDETIAGSANPENLETLFQWIYLSMTAPRSDPDLFKSYLGRMKDTAGNAMSNPDTVFLDKVYHTVFNAHPRAPYPPRAQDFDKISLDRVSDIYLQRFGNADGLTFVIAGSIDIDKVMPLVTAYLGNLPTTKATWSSRDVGLAPVSGKHRLDVKAGKDDKGQVVMMFNGPATYSLKDINIFYAAVEVINQRIVHVLREKLSLVYNGRIAGDVQRSPNVYYNITAMLPCAAADTDKVIAAMDREIERLKSQGPQPDELDSIKQIWHESRKTTILSNQFWVDQLQRDLLYHTNPETILSYDERISAISAQEVQDAARRYFNTNNEVIAVLHPAGQSPTPAKSSIQSSTRSVVKAGTQKQ